MRHEMKIPTGTRTRPPTGLFNDMYQSFAPSKPSSSEASRSFRLEQICPWPSLLASARSISMRRALGQVLVEEEVRVVLVPEKSEFRAPVGCGKILQELRFGSR